MSKVAKYEVVKSYKTQLKIDDREKNTIDNYLGAFNDLCRYLSVVKGVDIGNDLCYVKKEDLIDYKNHLRENPYKDNKYYAPKTINNKISGINKYFSLNERQDLKLDTITVRDNPFFDDEDLIYDEEIDRLERKAIELKKERLLYMIRTFRCTGIRVSEIKYITVEALKCGKASIYNKGSVHPIVIPDTIRADLIKYCEDKGIKEGAIFITRSGKVVDPSYIRKSLKWLAKKAEVNPKKIYPHNIRHYFALKFMETNNGDIATLKDILGHSNVRTTMIYLKKPMSECRRKMNNILKIIS